jgi:hypothetical protein
MTNDKPRGRPSTVRGAYNPHKARQLGRVSDEDWETLQAAVRKSGKTFTDWSLSILLTAAKRQLKA